MSILGYSTSYFLPEYWANTPLYGEKIIPLLDYMLSMDYENADNLAQAFYNIENKYKNQAELPIEIVETIIEENGYGYVKDLIGNSEESIRLLLSLMVLVHQLKGTKTGIMAVLNLLRRDNSVVTLKIIGNPRVVQEQRIISDFSVDDYVSLTGFKADGDTVNFALEIGGFTLGQEQCIASVSDYGFYIGIDPSGHLVLSLSSNRVNWNILNRGTSVQTLSAGNSYYIKLKYDGYEYKLQVSTDGKNYETWVSVDSTESLNINNGIVYLGADYSEGEIKNPFTGYINYADISIGLDNIVIEQWFEQNPVGPENTFIIKTDLEADIISADFFSKFSKFIKNYVYPSLTAFTASLNFKGTIALVSYARSKIEYVANVDSTSPINVEYGYLLSKTGISLPSGAASGAIINDNLVTHNGSRRATILSDTSETLDSVITNNSWEIVTKVNNFKGGSLWMGFHNIGLSGTIPTTSTYGDFQTSSSSTYKNGVIRVYTTTNNTNVVKHTLPETFNGYIKFEYSNESEQYFLSYSIDNKETWTVINTYASPGITTRNQVVFISLYQGTSGQINFDLRETYLTISNKKVWQAMQ